MSSDEAVPLPTVGSSGSDRPASTRFSNSGLKFRHLFGKENQKQDSYYNLTPQVSLADSTAIACSDRYFAVPYIGGGGPVYVSLLTAFGKVEPHCFTLNGHKVLT